MPSTHRIMRNTAYLSSAYIAQKFLSFVYFTLIARIVGVVDTGAYVFALSYSTIFSVFVDFGMSSLIQREIAQKPENTRAFVGASLSTKLVFGLASALVGLILIRFLTDDPIVWRMVNFSMLVMLLDSYNLSVWSAFRGHHQLRYEALSIVISQAITLAVGLTGLKFGAGLEMLIIALCLGSFSSSLIGTFLSRTKLGFWPLPSRNKELIRPLLKAAIPFGIAGACTRMFASIDSVILRQMKGFAAVGFYAVPNKVVFAAQFIPAAFAAAIYPAMSHYYIKDREKLPVIFEQAMRALLLLAFPMTVGVFVLTPTIIHAIYTSEYDASIFPMQILVWGILFGFAEYPIGSLLAAIGQQTRNTITRAAVMVTNIVLNLLLIPTYSFVGTSIAALVSYALLTGMGLYWAQQYIAVPWTRLAISVSKIIFASLVMGGIVYAVRDHVHFLLSVAIGMGVYAGIVLAIRVFSVDEIKQLLHRFRREEESV